MTRRSGEDTPTSELRRDRRWKRALRALGRDEPLPARSVGRQVAIVALVALVVVGVRAVLGIDDHVGAASGRFTAEPAYDIWRTLLGVTVAVWLLMSVALWMSLRVLFRPLLGRALVVAVAAWLLTVLGMLVFLGSHQGQPQNPLHGADWKMPLAVLVVLVSATPIPVGLWFCHAWLLEARRNDVQRAGAPHLSVRMLRDTRAFIDAALRAASLGIVAVVVTTGALRNAMLDARAVPRSEWPASLLLLYGAFFTVIFALVFVPAHLQWGNAVQALTDRLVAVTDDAASQEDWHERRERLVAAMGADQGLQSKAASAFGITAPLLTSAVAAFVPQLAP